MIASSNSVVNKHLDYGDLGSGMETENCRDVTFPLPSVPELIPGPLTLCHRDPQAGVTSCPTAPSSLSPLYHHFLSVAIKMGKA